MQILGYMENGQSESARHGKYVTRMIQGVVSQVNLDMGLHVPKNILVVGSDYSYTGEVHYGEFPGVVVGEQSKILGDPFEIKPRAIIRLPPHFPLTKIIDSVFEGERELSLIPDGKGIFEEAKKLGDYNEKKRYLFEVQYGSRLIWFYDVSKVHKPKLRRRKVRVNIRRR